MMWFWQPASVLARSAFWCRFTACSGLLDVCATTKLGKVAVIGAGGIGFDVSEYLTTEKSLTLDEKVVWLWGMTKTTLIVAKQQQAKPRQVWLLQRKESKVGKGLGKHPAGCLQELKSKSVNMWNGVTYHRKCRKA